MPASSLLARAFSLVSSRTSPTVFSSGRSSTVLRLLAGSASMARIGPACASASLRISRPHRVVLPVPPLPATAIVVVIGQPPFPFPPARSARAARTLGNPVRSVCGRKSAEVYSSMNVLSALSSR